MFIHDFKELEQEMQAQVVCMRGQYLGERARDGWLIGNGEWSMVNDQW